MPNMRIDLKSTASGVYRAIAALDAAVELDPGVRDLVKIRASQMNRCSYCVDQHAREARARGEDERRVWALDVWRETPFFDARERAALALTEAITQLSQDGVPDAVYAQAAACFAEAELAQLIGAIISINAWNSVGVGTGMTPPLDLPTPAP